MQNVIQLRRTASEQMGEAKGVWRRDGGQTGATDDQFIVIRRKKNPGDDAPGPSLEEGFCGGERQLKILSDK